MNASRLVVVSLAVCAFLGGCGIQDANQPSVGSISIDAKSDSDKPLIAKDAVKSQRRAR